MTGQHLKVNTLQRLSHSQATGGQGRHPVSFFFFFFSTELLDLLFQNKCCVIKSKCSNSLMCQMCGQRKRMTQWIKAREQSGRFYIKLFTSVVFLYPESVRERLDSLFYVCRVTARYRTRLPSCNRLNISIRKDRENLRQRIPQVSLSHCLSLSDSVYKSFGSRHPALSYQAGGRPSRLICAWCLHQSSLGWATPAVLRCTQQLFVCERRRPGQQSPHVCSVGFVKSPSQALVYMDAIRSSIPEKR